MSSEFILEIVGLSLLGFLIVFFTFFVYMHIKQNRRNEVLQKMLLEVSLNSKFSPERADMEEKLIAINRQFQETIEDFKDINHLTLRAQALYDEEPKNDFLKTLGLGKNNISVEEKLIFVLTPFSATETRTFARIREPLISAGYKVLRGDEQKRTDIFRHVVKNIMEAELIIANINGRNPNVMYELGIAHMANKPVIIVARMTGRIDDLPIDLRNKNIVLYKNNAELKEKLLQAVLQIS